MVADNRSLQSVGEVVPGSERCMPVDAAMHQDGDDQGIDALSIVRYIGSHTQTDLEDVNIRIADQAIIVGHTGCIPEHTRTELETRIRVVACPEDVAQRCGSCILNIADGEELQLKLVERANDPFIL